MDLWNLVPSALGRALNLIDPWNPCSNYYLGQSTAFKGGQLTSKLECSVEHKPRALNEHINYIALKALLYSLILVRGIQILQSCLTYGMLTPHNRGQGAPFPR